MPKLEKLLEVVAVKFNTEEREEWFSSVDTAYAYGQVPLHQLTANHGSFQIIDVNLPEGTDL